MTDYGPQVKPQRNNSHAIQRQSQKHTMIEFKHNMATALAYLDMGDFFTTEFGDFCVVADTGELKDLDFSLDSFEDSRLILFIDSNEPTRKKLNQGKLLLWDNELNVSPCTLDAIKASI